MSFAVAMKPRFKRPSSSSSSSSQRNVQHTLAFRDNRIDITDELYTEDLGIMWPSPVDNRLAKGLKPGAGGSKVSSGRS